MGRVVFSLQHLLPLFGRDHEDSASRGPPIGPTPLNRGLLRSFSVLIVVDANIRQTAVVVVIQQLSFLISLYGLARVSASHPLLMMKPLETL
jgi:hypothetical protein